MAQSSINVTEGSGKRLNTWDRTISATLVQDQFTLPGEYPLATYSVHNQGISIATANDHVLQIMAGASSYVRIRRIRIEQSANATAASLAQFQLVRLTTAGTGGTAMTPSPYDSGDAASTATAQFLPTVKGTEGTVIHRTTVAMRQALSATSTVVDEFWEWTQLPNQKPIIIPAGTANGIAIKSVAAIAGATITYVVEWVETAWLGA